MGGQPRMRTRTTATPNIHCYQVQGEWDVRVLRAATAADAVGVLRMLWVCCQSLSCCVLVQHDYQLHELA